MSETRNAPPGQAVQRGGYPGGGDSGATGRGRKSQVSACPGSSEKEGKLGEACCADEECGEGGEFVGEVMGLGVGDCDGLMESKACFW